jgi:hypothetical protein
VFAAKFFYTIARKVDRSSNCDGLCEEMPSTRAAMESSMPDVMDVVLLAAGEEITPQTLP